MPFLQMWSLDQRGNAVETPNLGVSETTWVSATNLASIDRRPIWASLQYPHLHLSGQVVQEPCHGGAIRHVVVDKDGHVEDLPDFDRIIDDARFPDDVANAETDGVNRYGDEPSLYISDHSQGGDGHIPHFGVGNAGMVQDVFPDGPPGESGKPGVEFLEAVGALVKHQIALVHGFFFRFADLLRDGLGRALVGMFNDQRDGHAFPLDQFFDHHRHIHVIEEHQLPFAGPEGGHFGVLGDGMADHLRQPSRKGQVSVLAALPDLVADPGNVEFNHGRNVVLLPAYATHIDGGQPARWEFPDLMVVHGFRLVFGEGRHSKKAVPVTRTALFSVPNFIGYDR